MTEYRNVTDAAAESTMTRTVPVTERVRLPEWLKRPVVASPVIRETEAALAWRGNVPAGLFVEALGYGG